MEGLRNLDFQQDAEEWKTGGRHRGWLQGREELRRLDLKVSEKNEWTTSTAVLGG